ncbi:MAG: NAD(P)-dependent oxidoreductase [Candidatus Thorarchaeota archaeon]|nr:MAG: NAD(P)-dependent oxidoreductase [Candidatus Thorarchaeota archaeon]
MKVLVFGGTGFLGSYLVPKLLLRGHDVTVVTRRESQILRLEESGVRGVLGDLLEPEPLLSSLTPQDIAIFMAMPLEFGRMSKNKIKEITHRTTQFISTSLAVGEELSCPVIITLGTSYRTGPGEVADESWPIERFGLTKVGVGVDRLIAKAIEKGSPPLIRMIPGQIYGPGGQFMQMYRMMKSGRFGVFGEGANRIPRVHVEDCAEAYALAIDKMPLGESYILADDTPCTMREFSEFMAECMGISKVRTIPGFIGRLVIGKELMETMKMDCVVSNEKAKRELGWQLKYPSYREGLSDTINQIEIMADA